MWLGDDLLPATALRRDRLARDFSEHSLDGRTRDPEKACRGSATPPARFERLLQHDCPNAMLRVLERHLSDQASREAFEALPIVQCRRDARPQVALIEGLLEVCRRAGLGEHEHVRARRPASEDYEPGAGRLALEVERELSRVALGNPRVEKSNVQVPSQDCASLGATLDEDLPDACATQQRL
jgi:hypothetical protein